MRFFWEQNLKIFFLFSDARQAAVNARYIYDTLLCVWAFAGFFFAFTLHTHSKLFFSAKGNVMGVVIDDVIREI